jgi:hypothetical protein
MLELRKCAGKQLKLRCVKAIGGSGESGNKSLPTQENGLTQVTKMRDGSGDSSLPTQDDGPTQGRKTRDGSEDSSLQTQEDGLAYQEDLQARLLVNSSMLARKAPGHGLNKSMTMGMMMKVIDPIVAQVRASKWVMGGDELLENEILF